MLNKSASLRRPSFAKRVTYLVRRTEPMAYDVWQESELELPKRRIAPSSRQTALVLSHQLYAIRSSLLLHKHLNPIGVRANQNAFSCERARHVLRLRVSLRHRENLPILKAIKKDVSKPAAGAAGTSIAICLIRRPSGKNPNGTLRKGSPWPLRYIQSAEQVFSWRRSSTSSCVGCGKTDLRSQGHSDQ